MGLDTTHNCWRGAYSGFREFRQMVGRAAGLPYRVIDDPDRYDHGQLTEDIDWSIYTPDNLQGRWRKQKPVWQQDGDVYGTPKQDDVLYLIVHSDCGGELRRGYLPRLRDRLVELEPEYERLTADNGYLGGRLRQFIDGLEAAIEAGEHVAFG
ncbi:hypothetical protein [Mycobacterium sp. NAZ190054]|uniref:hypothetical protein n=1 Tax=Mycobacterium sp. NAZ190054 TaxID=1747766 RepID=UPI0007921E0A|nr:hypothetical protein [Mycobacterium sp. NAZ190054]KWX66834.1 hypothetical protein ASJ79_05570 [Mycobacterium sp. NAZ190054]